MSLKVTSSTPIVISDDFKGYPLESFSILPHLYTDLQYVLIPGGLLQDRIERLACDIANDMGKEPFTALCVLKGGFLFFGDLLEKIKQCYRYTSRVQLPQSSSNTQNAQQICMEFITIKSYQDDESTGNVRVVGIESFESLRGKNVLVVEDIIDTGKTMVKVLEVLKGYGLKSIRVASLFTKRTPLSNGYKPEYVGFDIPNKFIVGCNLDYNEYFRDLSHVCVISDEGRKKYSVKK